MDSCSLIETRNLAQLFERSVEKYPNNIALECDQVTLSYQELEWRVNQLAHYLIAQGVGEQPRIAIFLDRSLNSYIAILAVLKVGGAYIPIEVEYPDERVNYIFADIPFQAVITSSTQLMRKQIHFPRSIVIDQITDNLSQFPCSPPPLTQMDAEQLCYVIYTSGTTGRPKGVEITHKSICHYVSVASTIYAMTHQDKVYQGFSLAFDASLEEFWMALANGATLVVGLSKDVRSGVGLVDFLIDSKVTVFSTVPTLLAALDERDISTLRLLILGGEACSPHLIRRHSRQNLRILNTYGPTEATVIATYAECHPDKPVTIGKALPGYCVLILDEQLQPVMNGQPGELCIGGVGLARGYVNQPDITPIKFVTNPNDGTQRLYRTGDQAMINADGDILFLGRVDDQVKIRGFRIELNEIEVAIAEYDAITGVVVTTHEQDSQTLVAYLLVDKNSALDLKQLNVFLRQRLPHYMIPAVFECIDAFPLMSSGKVNRKALPKLRDFFQNQQDYCAPETPLEMAMVAVYADILQQPSISVTADFFYDLGGHSLLAARIISNLRKLPALKTISILDLYQNPAIRSLADKFSQAAPESPSLKEPSVATHHPSTLSYVLCGIGQFFGCLLQYAIESWQFLTVLLCYIWIAHAERAFSIASILLLSGLFFGMPLVSMIINICAKWILIGRVKPGQYKLWGWFYFRWWLVDRLQHFVFTPKYLTGSPLMILYCRLLGAKIGSNCYIGSSSISMHDMITLGDNCSIGYDVRMLAYTVEDGWLKIGKITMGNHCFIGARSVIALDAVIHDHAVLDNMTMLPRHANIPAHQFFCGSPARQAPATPEHITMLKKGFTDKTTVAKNIYYALLHYLGFVFVSGLFYACYLPSLVFLTYVEMHTHSIVAVLFATPIAAIIYLCLHHACIVGCKKLLLNKMRPGIYPLKSLYYLRQWIIGMMIDSDEVSVMADSLYFPPFLRFLGAKLGKRVELGETPHIQPDLVTILDEGFVASAVGLAWPAVYQGWIQFVPIQIGTRAFTGNVSLMPLGSCLGDDGLLGALTTPPSNNQAARNQTSWLGSPAMFLPKREMVSGFSEQETCTPTIRIVMIRLAIELVRIILPTTFILMGIFILFYVVAYLFAHDSLLTAFCVLPLVECLTVLVLVASLVLLKWLVQGKLKPTIKPLWSLFIRKIDLIEYASSYFICPHLVAVILGTPFMSILLRSLGAKIGKKVFIYSDHFTEFDLISIGDNVCINAGAFIQTHLYEDRIFKNSTIDIHDGCNIGIGSVVLYETVMEHDSTLGSLSLLMKGERLPANTRWQGIPAQST